MSKRFLREMRIVTPFVKETAVKAAQARFGSVCAMRDDTVAKLSQNRSTIAAIIRISAIGPRRFSNRLMVGCEHNSAPPSGNRPTAILKAGSACSRIAVVGISVTGGDQQRAETDHLSYAVPHRVRVKRVFDTFANRSANPSCRSICAGNNTPPSEVSRPASKAAVTFLRQSAGKSNPT
jgi:hypothetical protein